MNETIDGILQFCKFFHLLHKMLVNLGLRYLLKQLATTTEFKKTFKQGHGDKKNGYNRV